MLALAGIALGLGPSTATAAGVHCDRVASTTGSDRAAGTPTSPFRTVQKLAGSLNAGQTGCIRAGTYRQDVTVSRGGTDQSPVTIRSYPGERAELVGRLWLTDAADHVTISHLSLDGSTAPACDSGSTCTILPSPTVYGDDVTFKRNNVTNHHTAICFNAGSLSYSRTVDLTITRNRIHDCGRFPRTNHDHGIYLQHTRGARITNNLIYDNADRGIQLYPDAEDTRVAHNVIDGNGTGIMFSGASGFASSGNTVRRNIITNSRFYNVSSWYPSGNPIGRNNVVGANCLFKGGLANTNSSHVGYRFRSTNVIANPLYRDKIDYRLQQGSPCGDLR